MNNSIIYTQSYIEQFPKVKAHRVQVASSQNQGPLAPAVLRLLGGAAVAGRHRRLARDITQVAAHRLGLQLAEVPSDGVAYVSHLEVLLGQALRVMRRPADECGVVDLELRDKSSAIIV